MEKRIKDLNNYITTNNLEYQYKNNFWSIWLEGGRKDITTLSTKKQQREEKRAEKKIKKMLEKSN